MCVQRTEGRANKHFFYFPLVFSFFLSLRARDSYNEDALEAALAAEEMITEAGTQINQRIIATVRAE